MEYPLLRRSHLLGQVDESTFTVLVVMFAIVPIVASIARFAIRLKNHRKPTWDDYFVLCATVCLIIETALVLDCQEELYELEFSPMPAMSLFTTSRISRFYIKTFIFTCLVWTAIFSIKLSFLALFRGLVWDISRRLKWFYIFVVGLTILTWFLIILQITLQNTLGCPALTEFAFGCPPINESSLPFRLWLRIGFDLATDLAIISIPLSLLSTSQMKTGQKVRVAGLLCLPIVMVVVTITRATAGPRNDVRGMRNIAAIWNTLLIHVEAGIAVLVASAVIFRSVLVGLSSQRASSEERTLVGTNFNSGKPGSANSRDRPNSHRTSLKHQLLSAPSTGTLHSLRQFIWRTERDPSVATLSSIRSSVLDYHDFIRDESRHVKSNAATGRDGSMKAETMYPQQAMLKPDRASYHSLNETPRDPPSFGFSPV